ncbi:Uncharacterized protein ZC84.1 [Toxocara canis]|uniref:Uncharacterized protein ZC84.1 n=1 Tax=Toxocara canis TaxID=6265 RepID=A0A0B2UZK3_TOXCA|nr:Uncharacterized protein ZC84.1 [Toxocara canis]
MIYFLFDHFPQDKISAGSKMFTESSDRARAPPIRRNTKRLEFAHKKESADLPLLLTEVLRSIALECDPDAGEKKSVPDDITSYLYCNLEGIFSKKSCPEGKKFNGTSLECESSLEFSPDDDPFLLPQYQAPDDLCGGGIPMTRLSAPVVCNPSISSCPDGYVCTLYARTGTSYCCQNPSSSLSETLVSSSEAEIFCEGNQVTFIESISGRPRSCEIAKPGTCPTGFGCNLIGGTVGRCCGKQFGCPHNSAGLINPNTGAYVRCSLNNPRSCQMGFICVMSVLFNFAVCCSDTTIDSKRVCPAGSPLGDGPTTCSSLKPCQHGYECVTTDGKQYCCPSRESVCSQPLNTGTTCTTVTSMATRFYFDANTGSCRSFQYTQCGGNHNNFISLKQCQGFCVERQCTIGGAHQVDGKNAICAPSSSSTCPNQFSCEKPLFGVNSICCSIPEIACTEMVTKGTACFGTSMTTTRFYYNTTTQKCEAFEFYGCSANNNNFADKLHCERFCIDNNANDCDGVAPLSDPNNHVQECDISMPCPSGYICNNRKRCCPTPQFACSMPMNTGNACSQGIQRTAWYYDSTRHRCVQFTYLGCGGTANRFADQATCISMCIKSINLGNCPLGMTPHMTVGQTIAQTCTLNVIGTCPPPSSCVRSTRNTPICCNTAATCPNGRTAYIIPGSDSPINCHPDASHCPSGNDCLESSVRGFYLCCSIWSSDSVAFKPTAVTSGCPLNIRSNGQSCSINAVNGCPTGYTCIPRKGSTRRGTCCATQPKCLLGKANFISNEQVQICGPELDGCPQGSSCILSSVSSVYICCQLASPIASTKLPQSSPTHRCANGKTPFYDPGSRFPRQCITSLHGQCPKSFACKPAQSGGLFYCCPVSPNECASGQKAYIPQGSNFPQTCSFFGTNNCAPGYSCQASADGSTSLCCADTASANIGVPDISVTPICPMGSSAYMYGGRPLACPPGSTRCPNGYACVQSSIPHLHLCCSSAVPQAPMCTAGTPYIDPVTNGVQFCIPNGFGCPQGFHCQRSTLSGQHICCTVGQLNTRYMGYCPMGQIPFVSRVTGEPRTCHMTLYPCPNTAPYRCIYSSEKLDSYCCAPIDTAITNTPNYYLQREDISGCPTGSKPLVNSLGQPQQCNPGQCPASFMCHFAAQKSRWQCCSTDTIFRKAPKSNDPLQCESGSASINGRCMRLLYIGQKGCQVNEQCSLKLAEARCEEGYCVCPRHKLIHQSKCVTHCPDGFVNIAARCHDLTTVVFMDSVDERNNGTIGGFCEATLIVEKQCNVENAFCNERSITCQCKPGFELQINFGDKNDTGSCIKIENSKFDSEKQLPTTRQLIDDDDTQYFILGEDEPTTSDIDSARNVSLIANDEPNDLERFLFQVDDQPTQVPL